MSGSCRCCRSAGCPQISSLLVFWLVLALQLFGFLLVFPFAIISAPCSVPRGSRAVRVTTAVNMVLGKPKPLRPAPPLNRPRLPTAANHTILYMLVYKQISYEYAGETLYFYTIYFSMQGVRTTLNRVDFCTSTRVVHATKIIMQVFGRISEAVETREASTRLPQFGEFRCSDVSFTGSNLSWAVSLPRYRRKIILVRVS